MITFEKIGAKVSVDYNDGQGRILNNTKQVLYNASGEIYITTSTKLSTTDAERLQIHTTEITGRPSDDVAEVAKWLVATYFEDAVFGSVAGYIGEFTSYNDLTTTWPAGVMSRFAFVLNSQGTKWAPGSIGGTYYGAGWYYDTGSTWSNKADEVYAGMEELSSSNIEPVTANYTALVNDCITADTTGGTFTITLPDATTVAGMSLIITKVDSSYNPLIVATSAGETILGDPTLQITRQYQSLQLMSDGINWFIK